jgi:hypothetical protein
MAGRQNSKPRAWRCTGQFEIFCPLCGDCTCSLTPDRVPNIDSEACPLHGTSTGHPYRSEMVA